MEAIKANLENDDNNYIQIKSLNVEYPQGKQHVSALWSVDLSLSRGKIGVIIGPSGCGKSTLLKVLAGLNSNYTGEVLVDNNRPSQVLETALILQNYGLLPWKNVWNNVALGLKIRKVPRNEIKRKTYKILEKLDLGKLTHRYPSQLSGGQQQRVAIARALVLDPELLLMDEPFSSLDALTREEMQELLLQIWHETNTTILLITHNIEEAVFLGQKIFIMSDSPGSIKQVVNNDLAGNKNLREKEEFLKLCNYLRSILLKR